MTFSNLGRCIKEYQKDGILVVFSDQNVAALYLDETVAILKNAGFKVFDYVVEPGEGSKSAKTYIDALEFLAGIPLSRSDGIVALGGGVIGDLAGFVAATFLRGIAVYQVPTTVLAAVDSSVGGKTGINLSSGKNLAGAFHTPTFVFQDCRFFETLPEEIFIDGMAEVIKYGMLCDEELLDLAVTPEYAKIRMNDIVERCVAIKQGFVDEDPFDKGCRQLLNFGHTFGHGIEKISDYRIRHGHAVAIGMYWMTEIAVAQGWCDGEVLCRLEEILKAYRYDLCVPWSAADIVEIIKTDKKRKGDRIDLVVPVAVGHCVLMPMGMSAFEAIVLNGGQ